MKKFAAFILLLTMLCTLLVSCGSLSSPAETDTAVPQSSDEMDELTHKFLADWYGYLIRCEYLYGDMRWALSYLDPFFEDHSWDSLQIARAALASAKKRAKSAAETPLELQITSDDWEKLEQSGIDVAVALSSVNSIQSLGDSTLLTYRNYQNYLNSTSDSFFLTYNLSRFEEWAHMEQQICDIDLRYCAVETDHLLLSLDDSEEKTHFVEYIAEKCPQINAWRQENPKDQDDLEKLAMELEDEMDALVDKFISVVGQSKAGLDLETDISDELNADEGMNSLRRFVSSYASDAVELKNFPIALPYPDWWYLGENEDFFYSWDNPQYGENEETGPRKSVIPGDTISSPPDSYIVDWENVSLEEYLDYVEIIDRVYKIPALFTTEKDGKYTAYYEFEPASFAIIWEENAVSLFTLEGSVCLTPPWYVYYTSLPGF